MSFCRAGKWVCLSAVVAAGMSFRVKAELYPGLTVNPLPYRSETAPLQSDFSLTTYNFEPHYLDLESSNLPGLLTTVPPQDLFSYSQAFELASHRVELPAATPAWDSLWQGAARISIATVPEPSAVALLGLGVWLLSGRQPRARQ